MSTRRAVLVWAVPVFLVGCWWAAAQTPKVPLEVTRTLTVTSLPRGPVLLPVRCDLDGNVYVRQYRGGRPLTAPVVKISSEGQVKGTFDLSAVPDRHLKSGHIQDFAIGRGGDVYLLDDVRGSAEEASRHAIVHFDSDGQYEGSTTLRSGIYPFHFAVLSDGTFLVAGTQARGSGEANGKFLPVTYIVDPYGHVVGTVTLPHDAKIGQLAGSPAGTTAAGKGVTSEPDFGPVALGSIELGEDGNAYLWRHASNPAVYVISPAAKVERVLKLASPGKGFAPNTIKAANGMIVVDFSKPAASPNGSDQDLFVEYNAETGEQVIEYEPTGPAEGALACYHEGRFSLLSTRQGFVAILEAQGQGNR